MKADVIARIAVIDLYGVSGTSNILQGATIKVPRERARATFGPYEGSSIRVWIDTTDPHNTDVLVEVISFYGPETVSEGDSTDWIDLGGTKNVLVRLWYAYGDNAADEIWGRVEWHYP